AAGREATVKAEGSDTSLLQDLEQVLLGRPVFSEDDDAVGDAFQQVEDGVDFGVFVHRPGLLRDPLEPGTHFRIGAALQYTLQGGEQGVGRGTCFSLQRDEGESGQGSVPVADCTAAGQVYQFVVQLTLCGHQTAMNRLDAPRSELHRI